MNGNHTCNSWVISPLFSLGCSIHVEVSHGATQMRLTPYRWESNKIEQAWVPEIAESHDEETQIGLLRLEGFLEGRKKRKII